MDIFKFDHPDPSIFRQGVILNNIRSKLWVERYRNAGEFKLVASTGSGLRKQLPIGSHISHTNTQEVMRVENHEISFDQDRNPEITITGRTYETFLEHRILGSNRTSFPTVGESDYPLNSGWTWEQATRVINRHTYAQYLNDDANVVPNMEVLDRVLDYHQYGSIDERSVRRGSVYSAVLELLTIDDVGIKTVRPGVWSPLGLSSDSTAIVIFVGVDRSDTVDFAYEAGQLSSADYLWSDKLNKNCAFVTSKWFFEVVEAPGTKKSGLDRRMMEVDASDLDDRYSEEPTGALRMALQKRLRNRGLQALSERNDVALLNPVSAPDTVNWRYREDYGIGDIVAVTGDYNESAKMRVIEHVETEDENGESAQPSFVPYEEET